MANLQDQLGLDRIQAQTAIMNAQAYNKQNSSQPGRFQIEGGASVGSTGAIGSQALSNPGEYQSRNQGTIDEPQLLNPYNYVAPVTPTSTSTSNIGIGDTFSGITKKKNTNIAQSTKQIDTIPPIGGVPTVPVSPTLAINQQQRLANIAKRQGIMGQVAPVAPIPSPTGLQGAELQAYNQLTPQEQKTFQALATQGIKAQTDYLQQSKANQEYLKSQEELNKQMEQNRDQAEDIQARQQLESTAKQVANLKQNIGYLGSQGQPGVSATKLDAVSNQVALAQKTYDDVVKIDQLNKANRQLGQESHAIQFTRQMTQLQDDLDSKVNKTIQGALNQFNAAELKGKLDTIPEIEAFQQQLYAQLDGDLSSIMDTNIEARKFLIDRYDRLAESQKEQMQATAKAESEYQKNANTLNKEMSNALGYFVNNNGEPLVDQKTGQQIVVPPETTTNYDASTGQMILITKNRDGTVGVQLKQVGTAQNKAPSITTVENPDGTKSTMQWNGSKWTPIQAGTQGQGIDGTTDFRQLAYKYPNEASMKNNNPAGLTWNSNFDAGTGFAAVLKANGINYTRGTDRPAAEGGAYVSFNTVQDGLNAYYLLWQQPQYQNMKVRDALNKWGTGALDLGPINPDMNVSQLNQEQLKTLQMKQLQKESPGFFKELNALQQAPQSQTTFSQQATDWGQNILGGSAKLTDVPKALKTEVSSYIAAKNKTTQNPNIAQINSTIDLVDTLINHPGREATTGKSSMFFTMPGGASAGFQAKLEQLTAANFMQGIKSMKGYGALSDAEGLKVGASISSLGKLNQGDEEFKDELIRLKGVLQNSLKSSERETGIKYDKDGFAVQGPTETAPQQSVQQAPVKPEEQPKISVDKMKRLNNIRTIIANQE